MTFDDFKSLCQKETLPEGLSDTLKSMWFDFRGDWDTAHSIAQTISTATGSWIHAYLHRKEGDPSNSSYWYSRAGKVKPDMTLEEEWNIIVRAILKTTG